MSALEIADTVAEIISKLLLIALASSVFWIPLFYFWGK
jgi:hypothetical protein